MKKINSKYINFYPKYIISKFENTLTFASSKAIKMVDVFKTNVQKKETAQELISRLLEWFPSCKMNFDLEDCDKIFRVENATNALDIEFITFFFKQNGFVCEVLKED